MIANVKQFPLLIGHPPFYSYSSVKLLSAKTSRKKEKIILSFEIWIFCYGQSAHDDDHIFFVAMTSTEEHRSLIYIDKLIII